MGAQRQSPSCATHDYHPRSGMNESRRRRTLEVHHPKRADVPLDRRSRSGFVGRFLSHRYGRNVFNRYAHPKGVHEGALFSGLPRSHSARMGERHNERHLSAAGSEFRRCDQVRAIGQYPETPARLTDVQERHLGVLHERQRLHDLLDGRGFRTGLRVFRKLRSFLFHGSPRAKHHP